MPLAIYCAECDENLASQDMDGLRVDRKLMKPFVNHPTFQDALKKALAVNK